VATPYLEVEIADESAVEAASRWWQELTRKWRRRHGRETRSISSPAVQKEWCSLHLKCRGREYLRIIYGPEYH